MTALRFRGGGDIRHPRPPFEGVDRMERCMDHIKQEWTISFSFKCWLPIFQYIQGTEGGKCKPTLNLTSHHLKPVLTSELLNFSLHQKQTTLHNYHLKQTKECFKCNLRNACAYMCACTNTHTETRGKGEGGELTATQNQASQWAEITDRDF